MSQALLKKMDHIEELLLEIKAKMDNFMGFDELGEDERREVELLRRDREVERGDYVEFDEIFGA
ncbi:hypothetical protein FHEFKHOI_00526 [Candidatus Methanoperedenaceae archaeon GB50]|nr:hypothetical protein AIOGIFDO_00523 [Candidatus Methanoperedenaceae archaeon GB37]CAD7769160.1 hypothetical protein FHEFKHOI_00526 [Candidatus Methanoperedenaceae archaeon GB50]CAD7776975.1 MAG: hypothetical protein KBONHNOK_00987 [Candidatus Methanoperedenaceae archaeon GB50]